MHEITIPVGTGIVKRCNFIGLQHSDRLQLSVRYGSAPNLHKFTLWRVEILTCRLLTHLEQFPKDIAVRELFLYQQ